LEKAYLKVHTGNSMHEVCLTETGAVCRKHVKWVTEAYKP